MQGIIKRQGRNAQRLSLAQKAILRWLRVDDNQALLEIDGQSSSLFNHLRESFRLRLCAFSGVQYNIYEDEFEHVRGSYSDIPWQSKSFNYIVFDDYINITTQDTCNIEELRRVLKDDGAIYISISILKLIASLLGDRNYAFKNIKRLMNKLEKQGFSDVSLRLGNITQLVLVAK